MRHAVANATATSGRGSAISKVNSCKPFSNEEILTDCLCTGRACAYASPALAGLGVYCMYQEIGTDASPAEMVTGPTASRGLHSLAASETQRCCVAAVTG